MSYPPAAPYPLSADALMGVLAPGVTPADTAITASLIRGLSSAVRALYGGIGSCCVSASDFTPAAITGALSCVVGSGAAFLSHAGVQSWYPVSAAPQTVTGLAPNSTPTLYLHLDGTITPTAGSDGYPVCQVTTNGVQVVSTNLLPTGRVNLGSLLLSGNNLSDLGSAPAALTHLGAAALAGAIFTGAVQLAADPAGPLQAATERYVRQGRGIASWADVAASVAALSRLTGPNQRHWLDLVNDGTFNNHPSLIRLQDGRYLVVYRKGSSLNATGAGSLASIVYRTSTDLRTWSGETTLVAVDPGALLDWQYPSVVQLANGHIVVSYYSTKPSGGYVDQAWFVKSTDNLVSFGAPVLIPPTGAGATLASLILPCGPIVQMGNGSLGLVYYTKLNGGADTFFSTVFISSADEGVTWSAPIAVANGQADSANYDEPSLLSAANGDLYCVTRDATHSLIRIRKSTAPSYGAAWTETATFDGQGTPQLVQMPSGTLVCLYRGHSASFYQSQGVLRSSPDGVTWSTDGNQFCIDLTNSGATCWAGSMLAVAPHHLVVVYDFGISSGVAPIRLRAFGKGLITALGGSVANSSVVEEGDTVNRGGAFIGRDLGVQETVTPAGLMMDLQGLRAAALPRMTLAQIQAIPSPAAGWEAYATDLRRKVYYNAGAAAWVVLRPQGVVALTDAATIATDASLGDEFSVTLAGNRTLGAPTNPTDGQVIVYAITQDGTGNRTLAYNAVFAFGTDVASAVLSTAAGKTDYLTARYNATAAKWHVTGCMRGY